MFPRWGENTPMALALLILLAFGSVFLLAKTDLAIREAHQVGKPVPYEHTITVEGTGKISATPDIATISFGVLTRGSDVASAQGKNSTSMNALLQKVKALAIAEDDVQTSSYTVYQDMPWNPETQRSEPGDWIVSQQVSVKVRDTSKISTVLQTVGESGATNIYGPNFTIDDPRSLQAQARASALEDAQKKAAEIAQQLGVKLVAVVGYSEYSMDSGYPVPYYARDVGGAVAAEAPSIAAGTSDVSVQVNVTYSLAN